MSLLSSATSVCIGMGTEATFQWTQVGISEILVRNQEKYFTMKMITHRNKLLRKAVGFPSLELFRTQLDKALSNLI